MQEIYKDPIFICNGNFNKVKFTQSSFCPVFTSEEKQILIEDFDRERCTKSFDGENMRIESISATGVEMSISSFFDFVVSNLLVKDAWKCSRVDLYSKLANIVRLHNLSDANSILSCRYLANVLATSVLIEDVDGFVAFAVRNVNASFSSAQYAASAGGSLMARDCVSGNPFINCAKREIMEELGLSVEPEFDGLYIAVQKYQPIALLHVTIPISWKTLRSLLHNADDFFLENKQLLCVHKTALAYVYKMLDLTDTARFQLGEYMQMENIKLSRSNLLIKQPSKTKFYYV